MEPLRLGRPSADELLALLADQATAELTYAEVGATAGELPDGYHHTRASVVLGHGDAAFDAGRKALQAWAGHSGAGAQVLPAMAPLVEGQDVLVVMPLGPVTMTAACRIVTASDTHGCFGFAYGTLPLHPESGEESFMIERSPDGTVRYSIVAFSRHSTLLARLGGPVSHLVQRRVISAYLEGVRAACR